jgi:alpha-tubulin suppressor-like RCC1 family protein
VILSDHTVRCWGRSTEGQLGLNLGEQSTNTIGDTELPDSVPVLDLAGTAMVAISAGYKHTCAISDAGRVYCWGSGVVGALGLGNTNTIGDNEHPGTAPYVIMGGFITVHAPLTIP